MCGLYKRVVEIAAMKEKYGRQCRLRKVFNTYPKLCDRNVYMFGCVCQKVKTYIR